MNGAEVTVFVTCAIVSAGEDPAEYNVADLVHDLMDESAGAPMRMLGTSLFRRLLADCHY